MEQIIIAIIALTGSLAGGLMGTNLINHRLDNLEKKLSRLEENAERIIEHEYRLKRLEE